MRKKNKQQTLKFHYCSERVGSLQLQRNDVQSDVDVDRRRTGLKSLSAVILYT